MLDHVGRGELQDELNRLSKQGQWVEMTGLVDDELLEQIAVVAPRDQIARRLAERYAGVADRISLVSPMAPDEALWEDVVRDLAEV